MSLSINTPDLLIGGIVLLSIFIGIIRGFVKELISLVSWIVAIWMAACYATPLAEHITFTKVALVRNLTSFLLIFVGIVFVGAIVNYVIGGMVRQTPFSVPDRILGSLFGVLRGAFFVTILVLIAGLTPFPEEDWWNESYAIDKFQVLAVWVKDRLPDENAKVFRFSEEFETSLVKKGS